MFDRVSKIVRISGFRCKPRRKGEPALGFGFGAGQRSGRVQKRVTAIPEVATHWSSGFSRLTDRPADVSLANGTKSAMAFSGWHARVLASMECRRDHAGRGDPADRVTPGLSMLTLRVSMAPAPVAGARRFGICLGNLRHICSDNGNASQGADNTSVRAEGVWSVGIPRFLNKSQHFTAHLFRPWIPNLARAILGETGSEAGVGEFLEGKGDRDLMAGTAGDGFGELHVADAGGEAGARHGTLAQD